MGVTNFRKFAGVYKKMCNVFVVVVTLYDDVRFSKFCGVGSHIDFSEFYERGHPNWVLLFTYDGMKRNRARWDGMESYEMRRDGKVRDGMGRDSIPRLGLFFGF